MAFYQQYFKNFVINRVENTGLYQVYRPRTRKITKFQRTDTPPPYGRMAAFLMDNRVPMIYPENMLTGVRIYASDLMWRQILGDLGAILLDAPTATDINFDTIDVPEKISPIQLKSLILGAVDNSAIIARLLGPGRTLPRMQARVVALLYKTGGMRAAEIKDALGYSPNTATHAVDTVIYQLRRTFGRDFIVNDHGVYRLGKL